MLLATQRVILHLDLSMTPHPKDAPALPLEPFIEPLIARQKEGLCFQSIEDERQVIFLSDIKAITTKGKMPAVAMLFCFGDRDKADPGFTNFKTGKVRIAKPQRNEAGGLSVHTVISLRPSEQNGCDYRMVCEQVTGFGRTPIQNFLRHEFRILSQELGYSFDREGSAGLMTRPLVEISGHPSEQLKKSLRDGRLLYVELLEKVNEDFGFDEAKYIKTARRDLRLSIARTLPKGEGLTMIEKVRLYAQQHDYDRMRVRWRVPGLNKPQTAQLDTARRDAGEALFVKTDEVDLEAALPDISETLSDELIGKMKDLLE
jgi:hypothetical protein